MTRPLDPTVQQSLDALLERPLLDPVQLRADVEAHLKAARSAAASSGYVDLSLALRIGNACLALLDDYDRPADEQQLIQAACRYFADLDDEEDDFSSVVGFEDDAEVLDHVVRRIGRADLAIDPA